MELWSSEILFYSVSFERLELEYNSSFGILALKAVEWSKGEIVGDESSRGYWNWNFQWNDFRMATDLFLGRLQ